MNNIVSFLLKIMKRRELFLSERERKDYTFHSLVREQKYYLEVIQIFSFEMLMKTLKDQPKNNSQER